MMATVSEKLFLEAARNTQPITAQIAIVHGKPLQGTFVFIELYIDFILSRKIEGTYSLIDFVILVVSSTLGAEACWMPMN